MNVCYYLHRRLQKENDNQWSLKKKKKNIPVSFVSGAIAISSAEQFTYWCFFK